MWDLKISEHGDLVFAAGRDFEFVEGPALLNQRIINRLRIKRGSWIFNRDSSLGSDLDSVIGLPKSQQIENVPNLIDNALEPMNEEINVVSVEVTEELSGLIAIVEYAPIVPDSPPDLATQNTVRLLVPIGGID